MDETLGRRTASGLLFTKGGSILVFREDSRRCKATSCCSRLGCGSKLFPNNDRRMHKAANEEVAPQQSHVFGKPNRMLPEGRTACDSTRRNAAITCETDNRPRRETTGRDLLARLKERVNASKKRSLSGGSSSSSSNTSSTNSSSSSRFNSRSLHRPSSMTRNDARNRAAVRMHRASTGSFGGDAERSNADQESTGRFLSRSLLRYPYRLQGGHLSYLEDSLDGSNEYLGYEMDENEEVEDYNMSNDRHRGMRMDIDDMSYEELLALGERIGTVNTGLSDDALSECLNRILFVSRTSNSHEDGDIRCIICQEEYFSGEEVAKMACKHYYHITCIQQWLQQKNWCPICKTVATSTKLPCA